MPDIDDIEWEIGFFEGIVADSPRCCEALKALGDLYTTAGRYREGLVIDRRLVCLLPGDALVHYNLACSLALLDEADEAFAALGRAIGLGYRDLAWMSRDSDLDSLRADSRYGEIVRRIRELEANRSS